MARRIEPLFLCLVPLSGDLRIQLLLKLIYTALR